MGLRNYLISSVLLIVCSLCPAATLTFETPAGAQHGRAVFQTSNNQMLITLSNLVPNPSSVTSVLTSLQFTLEDDTYSGGKLASSSAKQRTIDKSGKYTDSAVMATDWVYSRTLLNIVLSWNDGSGPDHGIIGDPNSKNIYAAANGSIANNKPHNPFLANSAQFKISLTGVDTFTGISNVKLGWGTGDSKLGSVIISANCMTTGGCNPTGVPEPGTVFMVAGAITAFGAHQFIRRRQAATARQPS